MASHCCCRDLKELVRLQPSDHSYVDRGLCVCVCVCVCVHARAWEGSGKSLLSTGQPSTQSVSLKGAALPGPSLLCNRINN